MTKTAAVVGAGPAGLIAAETLARAGLAVTVYEKMPSVGRKFLMAGRGGLNLTHSEDLPRFLGRYGAAEAWLAPMVAAYPPAELVAWAEGLGQPTFKGSSGRVFPKTLKASPLLRAWLRRLAELGVVVRTRHDWTGWNAEGALTFRTPEGEIAVTPDATLLALGGASWPKLGPDGAWADRLAGVAPFRPANVGVDVAWSAIFRDRFEGQPLKNVALSVGEETSRGDAVVTRYGLEGGAVYAIAAAVRDAAPTTVTVDLRPDQTIPKLTDRLARPKKGESAANHLRKALNLSPLEVNLLREAFGKDLPIAPGPLARLIKAAPLTVTGVQGLVRAISSAGGLTREAVDETLMLRDRPGVFAAGEMLDWEAPTGGYLLQASFATGVAAAKGLLSRLGY
ncbi:TIGR03862 family flavoprotein [Phenylobacterium sp. J367]|uniref:TIGR03862 family flavoprotein n=1 Tax=Phenylobacterium sp. J367 TaxID=2898435 RepID=UPI002151FC5E|nr:TIGR03862 family flavoprotein [Phenylobacterium sp. J367]MCR5879099.1 TIGR03862 family flavoprotein [Phenylobacterium sp. J367]